MAAQLDLSPIFPGVLIDQELPVAEKVCSAVEPLSTAERSLVIMMSVMVI